VTGDDLWRGRGEFSKDDRHRDLTTGDRGWHTMRFGSENVEITPRATVEVVRRMRERRLRPLAPTSTGESSAS
jgi:very-short-patch-repair endonuclease